MFAELLACSCFSFLRGASQPHELVTRAHKLGLHTLTLCDRDGLYGAVRGYLRQRELDGRAPARIDEEPPPRRSSTRYAIGAELTLAEPGLPGEPGPVPEEERALTVALLVQDARGYENLCRLLTLSHEGREKGVSATSLDDLRRHSEGLWALVVAPEVPPRAAVTRALLGELGEILRAEFPGRAAVAIYRHQDGFDAERQRWALGVARRFGLPLVATARPSYHGSERKPLADVLHCIRRGITLDEAGTELDASSQRYLHGEREMLQLFSDHPEWVHQSGEIAATLRFDFSELTYEFPCALPAGKTADETLRDLVEERIERRCPPGLDAAHRAQVDKELALIARIGVAPYFLSTREIVEIAREKGILCQGRGSAANSIVCYLLGITAVDPGRSNLLFERFLSEERAEPPDIDVDFEHERREEVIQEIYARYGRERAAMVSEVISYRSKSALREVGKVFGFSPEQLNRLSSTVNWWGDPIGQDRKIAEAGFDVADARVRQVIALAAQLRGFPRHLSIHVGGFVLSSEPLYRVAPIEPARKEERTVIPWDKDDIDALGFFKVDVLGLGMLTAIRKALESIQESGGLPGPSPSPAEALTRIPPDDAATYDLVCRADTIGIFQIESRAQMSMLPRLRPRSHYDLVVQVAIVRPGPIQGGMVHPYLRRRAGEETVVYPDSSDPRVQEALQRILERTEGVPLFQEQVMQIAIEGAGYSGGEADQLRRDMASWRKNGRLELHRDRLLRGFAEKGIAREFGESLFEQIKGFGEYGFPESHASSFALLVYASAWQKAHYPAHFVVAVLNSQPMGFYPPTTLVRDAQKRGVEVRDVCVHASDWDSTLEEPGSEDRIESRAPGAHRAVRLGLRLVHGLSEAGVQSLVEARRAGPFLSENDLRRRTTLKRDELRALAEAGALACLSEERRQSLWKLETPQSPGLFAAVDQPEAQAALPELRPAQQLVLDYERKGLSVSDHPLRYYRRRLQKEGVVRACDLAYLPSGARVSTAGLVLHRQRPATASGIVFVTLEDETGFVNLIFRDAVFEKYEEIVCRTSLLRVSGRLEKDARAAAAIEKAEGAAGKTPASVIHILAERVERLNAHREKTTKEATWHRLSRNFH